MQITANEAVKLAAEENTTLGALETMGFEIVVGGANTSAPAPAAPKVVDEALVAQVTALVKKGRKVNSTKNGRGKWVLGSQENLGAFRVIITADKGVNPTK